MKRFPFWIAIVGLCVGLGLGLGVGTDVHAATGTLTMSWDVCAPVVTHKVNSTAPASLIFSVLGCDEVHLAYQVRFLLTDANQTTPDAWRFDAGGCQTNQLIQIRSDPPVSLVKSCPGFKGANTLEIKNFTTFPPTDPKPYHETQMRGLLAVTYTAVTANPAQQYFLGEFRFDHLYSVNGAGTPGLTCGGNDTPVTLMLIQPTGLVRASDGLEYYFETRIRDENVTYGPPLTPAHAATWGQIKNQYR